MNKSVKTLALSSLVLSAGIAVADNHADDADEANVATPVEMYACSYNEGKGAADLDAATKKFNDWADKNEIDDYFAMTMVPWYSGPDQDFDTLWLGGSANAKTLGRIQDTWLAKGSKEAQAFAEVSTCDGHSAYSALQIKQPPERENSKNLVVTFADCNMSEGTTFSDLYEPLIEWGEYKGEHGSTAGMWVFFPSFGGGGETFDFKWVTAYQNLEDMGADWDQSNQSGWQKANELFEGKVDCDSTRAYLSTNRRAVTPDGD